MFAFAFALAGLVVRLCPLPPSDSGHDGDCTAADQGCGVIGADDRAVGSEFANDDRERELATWLALELDHGVRRVELRVVGGTRSIAAWTSPVSDPPGLARTILDRLSAVDRSHQVVGRIEADGQRPRALSIVRRRRIPACVIMFRETGSSRRLDPTRVSWGLA